MIVILLFSGVTLCIYISAPVDELHGVVTYGPPFKSYLRQAGLGLPDNLTLKDMPADLVLALMVGEDTEFPYHHGVALDKIYQSIERHFRLGEPLIGNSCITQQLVKNVFTGADHSFLRKYIEIIYSFKMERHFSKAEIFTLYVNVVQVGPDSFGLKQAAKDYFGKPVKQLNTMEDSFIVASLPAPVTFTRWFRERDERLVASMRWRMQHILQYTLIIKNKLFAGKNPPDIDDNFFKSYFHGISIERYDGDTPNDDRFKLESEREIEDFIQRRVTSH